VQSSSLKMTIAISGWRFKSVSNNLALHFSFNTTPAVTSVTRSPSPATGITRALIRSSDVLDTTVNLLDFAEADGIHNIPANISFQGLSAMILSFPSFNSSLVYDPDFSVALTGNNNNNGDGSNTQLLGLIALVAIPCACILLAVAATAFAILLRAKRVSAARASVNF